MTYTHYASANFLADISHVQKKKKCSEIAMVGGAILSEKIYRLKA